MIAVYALGAGEYVYFRKVLQSRVYKGMKCSQCAVVGGKFRDASDSSSETQSASLRQIKGEPTSASAASHLNQTAGIMNQQVIWAFEAKAALSDIYLSPLS